jgi:UPF0176 protein
MQANTALQAEAHAGAAQHVNIAAYKFVTFDNTEAMRPQYQDICSRLDLKGTILLTPEGINMFLSGPRGNIDEFLRWVRSDARFADLEVRKACRPNSRTSACWSRSKRNHHHAHAAD